MRRTSPVILTTALLCLGAPTTVRAQQYPMLDRVASGRREEMEERMVRLLMKTRGCARSSSIALLRRSLISSSNAA